MTTERSAWAPADQELAGRGAHGARPSGMARGHAEHGSVEVTMTHKLTITLSQEGQRAALLAGVSASKEQVYEIPDELLSRALALPRGYVDDDGQLSVSGGDGIDDGVAQVFDERPPDVEAAITALEERAAALEEKKQARLDERDLKWDVALGHLHDVPLDVLVKCFKHAVGQSLESPILSHWSGGEGWPDVSHDASRRGSGVRAGDCGSLVAALQEIGRLDEVRGAVDARIAEEEAQRCAEAERTVDGLCAESLDEWLDLNGELRTVYARGRSSLVWDNPRLKAHHAKLEAELTRREEEYAAALVAAVETYGDDSQQERQKAGVLPVEEAEAVIRDVLFGPLDGFQRYVRLGRGDVQHGDNCYYDDAQFEAWDLDELAAWQFDALRAVEKAIDARHTNTKCWVREHKAWCGGECCHPDNPTGGVTRAYSVMVEKVWNHRKFTREYAIEEPDTGD